ncbi:MAG: hypothetical protein IJT50_02305 [Lentisphaeria bacterium]|nr:hypothetical protein [Lentisphaeria bacterium]
MFRWFKVLLQLSREDDTLEKLEARCIEVEKKLDEFERVSSEVEAQLSKLGELNRSTKVMSEVLEQRIAEDKTALQNISSELEKCEESVLGKLDGIHKSAEEYVMKIHSEIQPYENNVSALGKKMEELKEAVSEFQR